MASQAVKTTAQNNYIYQLKVDGTGTAALGGRDSNKFTLTDNGTGDYTITPVNTLSEPAFAMVMPTTDDVEIDYHTDSATSALRFEARTIPVAAATAVLSLNGIKFHSNLQGVDGNDVSIEITGGATAGSEVITCTDAGAITVQVETTVSTATQVFAALMKSDADKVAVLSLNGIKFHSLLRGADGNDITIEITPGATAGSEVVTSTSAGAITVQVETGVSTATQVYAALKAKTDATVSAFVGFELITGATTWATAAAAPLAGGSTAAGIGATKARNFVSAEVITGATTWATAAAANLAGGVAAVVAAAVDVDFDVIVLVSEISNVDRR